MSVFFSKNTIFELGYRGVKKFKERFLQLRKLMEKKLFTFDEIKLKMANYCVYQERCHLEVEQKMREFVLIPEAKDELYLYLIQNNFLNEERFAKAYVRGKFHQKKWGKNKIKQHLKMKLVQEKLVKEALASEIEDLDYEKCLFHYLEKLIPEKENMTYPQKSKCVNYLLQKGFDYKDIENALANYLV